MVESVVGPVWGEADHTFLPPAPLADMAGEVVGMRVNSGGLDTATSGCADRDAAGVLGQPSPCGCSAGGCAGGVHMYACNYDYFAVSSRALTPPAVRGPTEP